MQPDRAVNSRAQLFTLYVPLFIGLACPTSLLDLLTHLVTQTLRYRKSTGCYTDTAYLGGWIKSQVPRLGK